MKSSDSLSAIMPAILKVQGEVGAVTRDRQVSAGASRTYKYATLDAVIEAIRQPCIAAGLVLIQTPTLGERTVSVETRLIHAASCEWVACDSECSVNNGDAQAIGSAQTYMRRYGIMSLLALAPEDDDGQAARGAPTGSAMPKSEPAKPPRNWLADAAACKTLQGAQDLYREAQAARAPAEALSAIAARGKAIKDGLKGDAPFFPDDAPPVEVR